jgi:hypothetical protein
MLGRSTSQKRVAEGGFCSNFIFKMSLCFAGIFNYCDDIVSQVDSKWNLRHGAVIEVASTPHTWQACMPAPALV